MLETKISNRFLEYFVELEDPRRYYGNKKHELSDILVLTILAVIGGAEGWVDVEDFGVEKEEWLKGFLKLTNGIPSHDTIGKVFSMLESENFERCFLKWVKSIIKVEGREIIAIDGKTLRRSHNGINPAIHMISAWASRSGLILGQLKTEDKSNEITAIPELLGMIDVGGSIVTIDAAGCQKNIARQIVEQEGEYVLALKANQRFLYEEVSLYLSDCIKEDFKDIRYDSYETLEKGHGRIEKRKYWITDEIEWLQEKELWEGLRAIGCVESRRKNVKSGEVTTERRYYITTLSQDAVCFADAVRRHWSIENSLHWCLDVTFNEDQCRVRKDHGAENFAIIRRIALNLIKLEKSKGSISGKRKRAGWNNNYLPNILAAADF
jgi:predicted transposase YbfD/YdcC